MTVNEMGWMWRKENWRKARCVCMDNYTYTNATMQPQGCTQGSSQHISVKDYQQLNYIKIGKMRTSS